MASKQFKGIWIALLLAATQAALPAARAQQPPNPAVTIAAQREAMKTFAAMDGVWRGPAWSIGPTGEKHSITQTERIGPFLDGSVKVIEGRGYGPDGNVSFNAFGIIAFDPDEKKYTMRSYALGRWGDFAFTPTADGYTWEIPAGPMTIRYAATIKAGVLHEVGDRIMPGKEPARIFEMTLNRVGDSDWPAAGAVPMK